MESKKCERKGRCMSRRLKVGDHFEMVVQKGKNVIIQQISGRRDARRVVIIGNGHSIELDDKNNVIWKDPGMRRFTPKFKQKDIAIYKITCNDGFVNYKMRYDIKVQIGEWNNEFL